ncbi:MAG: UPF0175 family protein [Lachnospiraceae bacterium]|nr:UPF0175 family protein [Lachnospiraceae bacterium]
MARVVIDVPEKMIPYVMPDDEEMAKVKNAMVLYPYIKNGQISHGKAAELLGMHKLDLINLYSSMGMDYLDMSEEELNEELKTVNGLTEGFELYDNGKTVL